MPSWWSGGLTPPNIAAIAAAMLSWVPGRGGGKGMGGGARGKVEVTGGAVCEMERGKSSVVAVLFLHFIWDTHVEAEVPFPQ